MGFVGVRDAEVNIASGCVGNAVSVGPGGSFYEYSISKDGVGFIDLVFQFHVSDLDKSARRGSSVLICGGVFISDPFLGGDISDNNSGLLGGFNE